MTTAAGQRSDVAPRKELQMKRTVIVFGLLSGAVSSAMMFLTLPLIRHDNVNFKHGEVVGYTAIVLSFLLVFFGIRSYRENHGGSITFGRAFTVGILITLISCVFYVVSWEIIYFNIIPDFAERYTNAVVANMRAAGANDSAIAAKRKEMKNLKALLDNPLTNAGMTFLEP